MNKYMAIAGLAAALVWPVASGADVWAGADLGLAGGALSNTVPLGLYVGASTRRFPLGGELSYQFLSLNPAREGLFTATAIYRHPIPDTQNMDFLARGGIAYIHGSRNGYVSSSTRPIIGAGVSYRIRPQVSLRAEYDVIFGPATHNGPLVNGSELLGGVTYHFAS
ncbi:MAG: hypothetical protein M0Z76_00615 [Gammaproteobacteria bacterium]|nr:hypothetical protein [Gammaproteobacteria bacterium]